MRFLLGALSVIVVAGLIGLGVIFTGAWNIAATVEDPAIVKWAAEETVEHSVEKHAAEITAPALDKESMRKAGFVRYDAMCVACHGAPGASRAKFARGLNPEPPSLAPEIEEWSPAELFWITKHGIKMTGMPGFGPTHSDDEIWDIVAFLQSLPDLTPQQYLAMRASSSQPSDTTQSRKSKLERHDDDHDH